jgi:FKBP-type peptidyl-prolyl cis-trans isomerase
MIRNILIFFGIILLATQGVGETQLTPQTRNEKLSYGLGVNLARNARADKIEIPPDVLVKALRDEFSGQKTVPANDELRRLITTFSNVFKSLTNRGVELNLDLMLMGFEDKLLGRKLRLPEQEINRSLITYQVELKRERYREQRNVMEGNLKKGNAFLAENKQKEGVVSLPSGLQYKILKAGRGRIANDGDTVECHYRGTLLNGVEFESSYRQGQSETFKVSRVILGWKEALKLMPAGSKWQLFIPPHLAYGVGGKGNDVGPNETLIYELELLAVR